MHFIAFNDQQLLAMQIPIVIAKDFRPWHSMQDCCVRDPRWRSLAGANQNRSECLSFELVRGVPWWTWHKPCYRQLGNLSALKSTHCTCNVFSNQTDTTARDFFHAEMRDWPCCLPQELWRSFATSSRGKMISRSLRPTSTSKFCSDALEVCYWRSTTMHTFRTQSE